jgi:hypothetical protein
MDDQLSLHKMASFEDVYLRACKSYYQSATSAKLNPDLRVFSARCAASHLISGCSLHQKQDLLAFGLIVQNLVCLLSLNHETFYRL